MKKATKRRILSLVLVLLICLQVTPGILATNAEELSSEIVAEDPIITEQDSAPDDQVPAIDDEAEDVEPVAEDEEPADEGEEPVVEDEDPVIEDEEPDAEEEDPADEAKDPVVEEAESITEAIAEEGKIGGVTVQANSNSPTGFFVTFMYKNEEATKVELESALIRFCLEETGAGKKYTPFEWTKEMFVCGNDSDLFRHEMTPIGDGWWATTIPLPSGSYPYRYRIDGARTVPDPENPGLESPISGEKSISSIVHVPFDSSKQLYDLSFGIAREDTEKGQLVYDEYTDFEGTKRPIAIYLPPGFDVNREEPYKIQIVSHGFGGMEIEWMHEGNIPNIMDNLIADGVVEPYIVVSVNNSTFNNWNTKKIQRATLENLLPFMVENYNVSRNPRDRAYSGYSYGGRATAQIYYDCPTDFGYFGIWSGTDASKDLKGLLNLNKASVMIACGNFDTMAMRPTGAFSLPQMMRNMDEVGLEYGWHELKGAHDWFIWQQAFVIFARDYLWKPMEGVSIMEDPESPTGYTVTFVYKNENATAVRLAGDLTLRDINDSGNIRYQPEEWQTGRYHVGGTEFLRDMTPIGDGYWTVSIPMHAGGLSYWYRVDDPSQGWENKRIWDPTSYHPRPEGTKTYRVLNNDVLDVVYVPYSEKQDDPVLESRAKYELPIADPAQRGTVQYIEYTNILDDEGHYLGVYLPPGYDPNREKPYKVVYLAHGGSGDETDWMIPGNIPNILDNLTALGEIEPTILVTMGNQFTPGPGGRLTYNSANATRNLVEIILPIIEANFNVSTEREGRAFGGFSAGGGMGGYVIREHSDKFGYFAFMSGSGGLNPQAIAEAVGENVPFVFLGNGAFEGPLSSLNNLRDGFRNVGIPSETAQVRGAHDMMTSGQLFTIFAKNYLWNTYKEGANVKADPESPTGYTVTFVYKNENASGVRLAGDLTLRDVNVPGNTRFQPEEWQTGRYHVGGTEFLRDMTPIGSGYWSVSIPMHAGGLSYWYRVDDPSQGWENKRIWDPTSLHPRPAGTKTYRVNNNDVLDAVYVPYDEKQNDPVLESRAKYELPIADPDKRGTVQYVEYTTVLGDDGHYLGIYLPAGYDADREEPYKVMYLSHGIFGDETDWMVPGNTPNILDNMIGNDEIEPTIIVTMGNHFSPGSGFASFNIPNAVNNLINVIIPFMEEHYNVSTEREGRAYGGFSYGGMTGVTIINEHHDKFGYFAFFSGSGNMNYTKIAEEAGVNVPFVFLGNGVFEGSIDSLNRIRDNFRSVDIPSETAQVNGAHDMMTSGQLFTIFAKNYLWKTEELNQVSISSEPNTVMRGDNKSATFKISVLNMRQVGAIQGVVTISDSRFEITNITACDSSATVYRNLDYKGDGLSASFILAKIDGFDDVRRYDAVNITVTLKDGETLESGETLTSVLESIEMSIAGIETSSVIVNGEASTTIYITDVLGDLNGDDDVTLIDFTLSMTLFGKTDSDADWYTGGAFAADVNDDGIIDMEDLCIIADLVLQYRPIAV